MCTVTFVPSDEGCWLTANRDERPGRGQAIRPMKYGNIPGAGVSADSEAEFLYPLDPDSGGSWIGLKNNGAAGVLLNGAFRKHPPGGKYSRSRGLVFLEIFRAKDPADYFSGMDLAGVEPFTLVLFSGKADKALHECRWDGLEKYSKTLCSRTPHIWSSVTLYTEDSIRDRTKWFGQWQEAVSAITAETILAFHQQGGEGDRDNGLVIDRDGKMKTVSITSIQAGGSGQGMIYLDLKDKDRCRIDLPEPESKNASARIRKGSGNFPGLRRFFIKLFNWEYWPFGVVYAPLYIYWLFLGLRARSFFFFNASNPSIRNGGFLMESKKLIYDLMPEGSYPLTILVGKGDSLPDTARRLGERGMGFPLIAKPDIGLRGLQVNLLKNADDLAAYTRQSKVDFLVQEYISYEQEVGIFYYRIPGEDRGHLSGIVGKKFLCVTGDGRSSLEELLLKEDRYALQLPALRAIHGKSILQVPASGAIHTLVPYGNHSRGAKFIDLTHRVNEPLSGMIDGLCRQIPGFYYGRLDIRFRDWDALCAGRDFSVIEVNGAGSEPTHIYDPAHSLFFAWKEIIRHWDLLLRISLLNSRDQGLPLMSAAAGLRLLRDNAAHIKLLQSP